MIAEIALIIALTVFVAGGGVMFWSMKDRVKSAPFVQPPPVRGDTQALEREVFAKADRVCKIAKDTQEIAFPEVEVPDEEAVQPPNINETTFMKSISNKVSKIRKSAGME